MQNRVEQWSRPARPRAWAAALIGVLFASQAGCTRQFFREWANQDVSEAVFEKSRDPRFRLDTFSVDPPALSRFADPYDPDVPPAPPDDHATEALSPVPQWPDNRLITPVEGTGYLDMMESWGRYESPSPTPPPAVRPNTPPPATTTPFAPRPAAAPGNSGTTPGGMSPIPLPVPPASRTPRPGPPTNPPQSRAPERSPDLGVRLAAFQETGLPLPVPPPAAPARGTRPEVPRGPVPDQPISPIGSDPGGNINPDLSKPFNPRPDLTPDQYRASEAMGAEMSGLLIPAIAEIDEAEAAGLPKGSRPYQISMAQALQLALTNSRPYQFQLEQIYILSLAVTLQRFTFTPQFYAGMSPITPPLFPGPITGAPGLGFPPPNPVNSFLYNTRASGTQVSLLNLGTVAGVGKAFDFGAKLVTGFANQVVFNFVGKHPQQPTVRSFLPLSLVVPFLRGGGRAVTLELLTQAERNLVYQVRTFAKFRQEFMVSNLVGGSFISFGTTAVSAGFSTGTGNTNEPVIGFINVLEDLVLLENLRRNIAAFEHLFRVYNELKEGEASGLTPLQVDQIGQQILNARSQFIAARVTYRNDLDQYKMQLGLPPDVPLILDRRITRPFKRVYDAIDQWAREPRHELTELPALTARLPQLEDVVIDGRSVQGIYPQGEAQANEDQLNELYLAAERVALERRLDLMNARAQLYDAWRQIRVTANALKGVFNVAITNTFVTPPATTNPFAFLDQAKQFSLVFNTELPLIRMAERNNFRASLINYQRQRRQLQNAEDTVKLQVRQDIRGMQQLYLNYQIARKNIEYFARLKDQAFEQIIAPPAVAAGGNVALAATQTNNLVNFQGSLINAENALITAWQQYEVGRLVLYRDLGTLPYDEWEALSELFPSEYNSAPTFDPKRLEGPAGAATAPVAEPVRGR